MKSRIENLADHIKERKEAKGKEQNKDEEDTLDANQMP